MSKLFDQLKEIQAKSAKAMQRSAPASKIKEFPAFLVLTAVVMFIQVMTLNENRVKERALSSMDNTIQAEQRQLSTMDKKFSDLKTSTAQVNSDMRTNLNRINKGINTTMDRRFDDLDQRMEEKFKDLDAQAQKNADDALRMETLIKTHMNQMNVRLLKLQNMVNRVYQIAEVETSSTPLLNGE